MADKSEVVVKGMERLVRQGQSVSEAAETMRRIINTGAGR